MSVKSIAIYGAGGLGKEVLALIERIPQWSCLGFYDDSVHKDTMIKGYKVLGGIEHLKNDRGNVMHLIIAIGDPAIKSGIVSRLKGFENIHYPTLVDPSAIILDPAHVNLGHGTVVGAGCILTTDITVGKHVLININATVGHECRIGDCSSLMPGVNLAGSVSVGTEVLIGAGANVLNGISLGNKCKVGMGSVVLQNIGLGRTAVGVPAQETKLK